MFADTLMDYSLNTFELMTKLIRMAFLTTLSKTAFHPYSPLSAFPISFFLYGTCLRMTHYIAVSLCVAYLVPLKCKLQRARIFALE